MRKQAFQKFGNSRKTEQAERLAPARINHHIHIAVVGRPVPRRGAEQAEMLDAQGGEFTAVAADHVDDLGSLHHRTLTPGRA